MAVPGIMRWVRNHLAGDGAQYTFQAAGSVAMPPVDEIDLYLHIPFCRSLCPYCPYNRILYQPEYADTYTAALLAEIELYGNILGPVKTGSIYIGGGTPTTLIDKLALIITKIRDRFTVTGNLAIETTPADLDSDTVKKLRDLGINLLSIGVQSFDDRHLKQLGRNYRSEILPGVIDLALSAGFDSVNLDLMFTLPGQTIPEAVADLRKALKLGAEQVTLYPLFTFPYSAAGEQMKLHKVKFPPFNVRRAMYSALYNYALAHGLSRASVWCFKHDAVPRFSSVTRDVYIGLGAGAGSCLPGLFYFNTFSIRDYIQTTGGGQLPIALKMALTPAMERYYWLYWRLYDSYIPKAELRELFRHDQEIRKLAWIALRLGLAIEDEERFILTERGSFWIHLLQNYYILNYVDKVWSTAMKNPWPGRIEL